MKPPLWRACIKHPFNSNGLSVSTSGMSKQKIHDELDRIEALHRHWNRLSMTERASIAKTSPDLSVFFRSGMKHRSGTGCSR